MAENGHSRIWLWVLIGGGAFFLFVLAVFTLVYVAVHAGGERQAGFHAFGDKIGVVDLDGVILDPSEVVDQLRRFSDDDSIKAIIIHVNSPGGGVAASEEIYREVKRIRDGKKKRIVSSILKVGEFKDTGDPTRELTPAERQYMQGLIDNMYLQFVNAVADGRHAKVSDIKPIADGRVWTGEQALNLHLIDQIADFRTAVQDTAKSVGISGEPVLVHPERQRQSLLDLLFGDVTQWLPTKEKLLDQ